MSGSSGSCDRSRNRDTAKYSYAKDYDKEDDDKLDYSGRYYDDDRYYYGHVYDRDYEERDFCIPDT